MPTQLPAPPPCGVHAVQVLRTYPYRRPRYPYAPDGERSIARGYCKAISQARRLIYLEDQYLWSPEVADVFAQALANNPELRLVAVVPAFPDQASVFTRVPQLLGRSRALNVMRRAGGDRVAVYSLENEVGTPVYVHAKVCIVDDVWATVGSDNLNLRLGTELCRRRCLRTLRP
jgi:phosphatidylserine/phosphatidylglycerophosphate/cardiolipin synthase-like enzyme